MRQEALRGAYGFALAGPGTDHGSLPVAPPRWPRWTLAWTERDRLDTTPPEDRFPVLDGGEVHVDVSARTVTVFGVPEPSPSALMHPWLSFIGTVVAQRAGMISFHAGGAVRNGATWGILGAKHAGKTSTLAWLSQHGCAVTSDDLMVLDGAVSLAGPGCLDLRAGAAEQLTMGERETLLPGRDRWRVWLPTPPAESPLAGFVWPEWSDDERSTVEELPPSMRMPILAASRAFLAETGHERRILELAALPMLRWRRPRDFGRLEDAGHALLRAFDSHGDGTSVRLPRGRNE